MPFALIEPGHSAFPRNFTKDTATHVFGQRVAFDATWDLNYSHPAEFGRALDWCRENVPSSLWANVADTYVVIHSAPEAFAFKMRWC
ncbi:MAG: hypothetical protein EOP83_02840 [Verrucomicrobiaceae bacterium]|nr:MAG: hypothetical protein EOP83_02840 [Verrucomicrobiaceae bacterium]